MADKLTEVLTLLQAAKSPSRDIDFLIAEIVAAGNWPGKAYWKPENGTPTVYGHADTYTQSLDAAIALAEHMKPGAAITLEWQPTQSTATAMVGEAARAKASSPALAVVVALFEALAAG